MASHLAFREYLASLNSRSAYETAFHKAEKLKQSKKEREKIDADEELDKTRQRL
jgi:hypothetical protein